MDIEKIISNSLENLPGYHRDMIEAKAAEEGIPSEQYLLNVLEEGIKNGDLFRFIDEKKKKKRKPDGDTL